MPKGHRSYFHLDENLKIEIKESHRGSAETNLTSVHEDTVPSLASLSGLRIQCCPELWCMLQTQLRSGVAVADIS